MAAPRAPRSSRSRPPRRGLDNRVILALVAVGSSEATAQDDVGGAGYELTFEYSYGQANDAIPEGRFHYNENAVLGTFTTTNEASCQRRCDLNDGCRGVYIWVGHPDGTPWTLQSADPTTISTCVLLRGLGPPAAPTTCVHLSCLSYTRILVDECASDAICGVNGDCADTPGSFSCSCHHGYSLDDAGFCGDVDECAAEIGAPLCSSESSCRNTVGSYECACDAGYEFDPELAATMPGGSALGQGCRDIDECLDESQCSSEADCRNTDGSFGCSCRDGWAGDGVECANVDECSDDSRCPSELHQVCTDIDGSFRCHCDAGWFATTPANSSITMVCGNVDECGAGTATCAAAGIATCTDTAGSFSCSCDAGFFGDGTYCSDVDECAALGSEACGDSERATCTNTEGGHQCDCEPGWDWFERERECHNAYECDRPDACSQDASCDDTVGSFTCTCHLGFSGDGTRCRAVDYCLEGLHTCAHDRDCMMDTGSRTYSCHCPAGFVWDEPSLACADVDECAAAGCHPTASCSNSVGSFSCSCAAGFVGTAAGAGCVPTPTAAPTAVPATSEPSPGPTARPSASPTAAPTAAPTASPTPAPSAPPSPAPTTRAPTPWNGPCGTNSESDRVCGLVVAAGQCCLPAFRGQCDRFCCSVGCDGDDEVPDGSGDDGTTTTAGSSTLPPSSAPSPPPTTAPSPPPTTAPTAAPTATPSGPAPTPAPTQAPTLSTTLSPTLSPFLPPTSAPSAGETMRATTTMLGTISAMFSTAGSTAAPLTARPTGAVLPTATELVTASGCSCEAYALPSAGEPRHRRSETAAPTLATTVVCSTFDSESCPDSDDCILDWQTTLCREQRCGDIWEMSDCVPELGCENIEDMFLCNEIGAPIPCGAYWEATTCPSDRCDWRSNEWNCVPRGEEVTTVGPTTPVNCEAMLYELCETVDGCGFDWDANECRGRICADNWERSDCETSALGCEYLEDFFICNEVGAPVPCNLYWQENECPDRCFFQEWNCQPCDAVTGCPDESTTAAASTATADPATATSGVVCTDLDASTCNSAPERCIIDNAGCRPLRCSDNLAEEACVATDGCEYLADLFFCNEVGADVPCTNIWSEAQCPRERCSISPAGRCEEQGPTRAPTRPPTAPPSDAPATTTPSMAPTTAPSMVPTTAPSVASTNPPTILPSVTLSVPPTVSPSIVGETAAPSTRPTASMPTDPPTVTPTGAPASSEPSPAPTSGPTAAPINSAPSASPTPTAPTDAPAVSSPTTAPSPSPSPTNVPTPAPIPLPTGGTGGHSRCPCWSGAAALIDAQAATTNGTFMFYGVPISRTYGTSCEGHDAVLAPYCAAADGVPFDDAPGWCTDHWCWVDPNDCEMRGTTASVVWPGSGLMFNYHTCRANSTLARPLATRPSMPLSTSVTQQPTHAPATHQPPPDPATLGPTAAPSSRSVTTPCVCPDAPTDAPIGTQPGRSTTVTSTVVDDETGWVLIAVFSALLFCLGISYVHKRMDDKSGSANIFDPSTSTNVIKATRPPVASAAAWAEDMNTPTVNHAQPNADSDILTVIPAGPNVAPHKKKDKKIRTIDPNEETAHMRPSKPESADATNLSKKEKRVKKDKGALAVNPVYRTGTLPGATAPSAAEDDPEAFDLDNYYADHRSKALERREENRLQVAKDREEAIAARLDREAAHLGALDVRDAKEVAAREAAKEAYHRAVERETLMNEREEEELRDKRDAARSRLQQRKNLGEAERAAAREAIRAKRRQLNLQRQDLTTVEEDARDAEIARRERVKAEQARVARAAAAR